MSLEAGAAAEEGEGGEMIVHESSWHLKVARWGNHNYQPRDLCSYFWRVTGRLLWALAVIYAALYWGYRLVDAIFDNPWWAVMIVVVPAALLVISGVVFLLLAAFDAIPKPHFNRTKKQKPPSLVGSYIKAKKRRVCPLIELEP